LKIQTNPLYYLGIVAVSFTLLLNLAAGAEEPTLLADSSALSFKYLSAAIAFTGSAIGAGWAVSKAGAAGLAGTAERPEIRTTAIIITALGEAIAIYGIVIAILILGN